MSRRSGTPAPPSDVTHAPVPNEHAARRSRVRALVRTARPKQWVKNLLVFAAPGAAGKITHGSVFVHTFVALLAFCLASSGTYFWNDALDADSDRLHPTKRLRPVAARDLGTGTAKAIGTLLLVVAIGISIPVEHGRLAIAVGSYVALTVAYSVWLKHQPILDLAAVAGGFVIRAIAGGMATNIPISRWFLVVTSAASLFMVTGKRHAELLDVQNGNTAHRRVLAQYPSGFLNYVRSVTSGVAIMAYCLWAFDKAQQVHNGTDYWYKLSIVPFVLALLRYALLVEQGQGGAPEEIALGDRTIQVLGIVWIIVFAIGLHVA